MYQDEYGRTWKFKPGHDTTMMLQISPELLHAALQLRDACSGAAACPLSWLQGKDCYLIRMPTFEEWCVGARFSDEPQDYLSPYLDQLLIDYMLLKHRQQASRQEWRAIEAIDRAYPPPGVEHEVWAVLGKRQDGGLPSPVKSMSAPDRDWLYHSEVDALEAQDAVTRYYGREYAGVFRCLLRVVSEVQSTKE